MEDSIHLSRNVISLACVLLLILISPASSQTWSACNPLLRGDCPADPALGKTVNIDFSSASDSFSASGALSYGSNGAAFTVQRSGDSPTITSKWYIMFGHVDFVVKAAPGTGIVSSAILQSDCLDEIDFEWLGGDNTQVQSNFFGKGQTGGYNRGAFHGAAGNHDQFRTYSIDWTSTQIVWSIDGQTVRVLTAAQAGSQYPQTPMQIKVGIWAGGDPSNAAGTVQWAGGYVNYAAGPYTMYLKSMRVQDYSTGSSYSYSGTSGTWSSIKSNGGSISGIGSSNASPASQPPISSASGAPIPFSTSPEQSSIYATRTGFPWVLGSATPTTSNTAVVTSYSGLPSGWIITDSGKVVPPSTGSTVCQSMYYSSACVSVSSLASTSESTRSYTLSNQTATSASASTTSALLVSTTHSLTSRGTTLVKSTSILSSRYIPMEPTQSLTTNPTSPPKAVAATNTAATMYYGTACIVISSLMSSIAVLHLAFF